MADKSTYRAPGEKELKPGDKAWAGTPGTGQALCPDCGGSGKIEGRPCPTCEGTGIVIEGLAGG